MHLYSQKIICFIAEIKTIIKNILSKEVLLRVSRGRFYDRQGAFSYPIKVVIYDHKNMLGYFDPEFYELGFHERLMYVNRQQLSNIIRHELAHYITFINYRYIHKPHSAEFKATCERFGWGEDVYRASISLEECKDSSEVCDSDVFRKVKKLMALATSSNQNEAEQAMIKSQQLLLKHNMDAQYVTGEDEDKMFLKRILRGKKRSAKVDSIANILETFFVDTVYASSHEFVYLEIVGTAVNIEIAEYVANFLEDEMEKLWDQVKATTRLKGITARNSFFYGLAKGYCDKIEALRRNYTTEVTKALTVIEKKLVDARSMIYQDRLKQGKSRSGYCSASSILGQQMGRELNIRTAINSSSGHSNALISFAG